MTPRRSLSPARRHKVTQIQKALGESDGRMHGYMSQLDLFDRSTAQDPTRDLDAQRVAVLDKTHDELLHALQRLGALDTGLLAQDDLRRALINAAAGYAAWSFALGSRKPGEIAAARVRAERHFNTAATYGERGASRLERGV